MQLVIIAFKDSRIDAQSQWYILVIYKVDQGKKLNILTKAENRKILSRISAQPPYKTSRNKDTLQAFGFFASFAAFFPNRWEYSSAKIRHTTMNLVRCARDQSTGKRSDKWVARKSQVNCKPTVA